MILGDDKDLVGFLLFRGDGVIAVRVEDYKQQLQKKPYDLYDADDRAAQTEPEDATKVSWETKNDLKQTQ